MGMASGIVLVLVLIGALEGKRGYGAVKVWRAENLIAQSVQAQARGDDAEARRFLREAGVLLAGHPTMLRAVAQYHARRHEPNCLDVYEVLGKMGYATAQDWIEYTRQAFYLQLPDKAARGLKELQSSPNLVNTPPVIRLEAERAALEGKWRDAMFLAGRAVDRLGGESGEDERLFLARVLVRIPNTAVAGKEGLVRESIEILDALAARRDTIGKDALDLLVELARSPGRTVLLHHPKVAFWMESARANPWADDVLRAQCWELRLAAEPEKRDQTLAEFLNYYRSASPNSRLEAARWLQQHHEYALVLEISESSRLLSEEWYTVYLDGVAGLGDWERVLKEMDSDLTIALPAAIRRLFRLRAELETQRNPDTVQEWTWIRNALEKADTKERMYVAGYAEQIGFPKEAAAIYEELLKGGMPATIGVGNVPNSKKVACYMGLLRTKGSTAPLVDFVNLLKRFAAEYRDLDEVQSDAAYYRLLLGDDDEEVKATVNRLLNARPDLLAYRTDAALLALREKHPDKAVEVYDHWQTSWTEAADRFKAVRVAVLEANGRESEAAELRSMIHADHLRPEEKALAGISDSTRN